MRAKGRAEGEGRGKERGEVASWLSEGWTPLGDSIIITDQKPLRPISVIKGKVQSVRSRECRDQYGLGVAS